MRRNINTRNNTDIRLEHVHTNTGYYFGTSSVHDEYQLLIISTDMILAFSSFVVFKLVAQVFFNKAHKFSMGLRSGDCGGQSRVFHLWALTKAFAALYLWHGAP